RAVLHRSSQPTGIVGRHHAPSELVLDAAGGAQCNDAGHRISERLSLPAARSRQEVLPRLPGNTRGRRCGVHTDTRQKSEPERPRGTLGTFDQRGMLVEADPVRGEVVATCGVELLGTLSPRTKPSRQGQSLAVPRVCAGPRFARRNLLSRAARRLTQILQWRRMSILTKRELTITPRAKVWLRRTRCIIHAGRRHTLCFR